MDGQWKINVGSWWGTLGTPSKPLGNPRVEALGEPLGNPLALKSEGTLGTPCNFRRKEGTLWGSTARSTLRHTPLSSEAMPMTCSSSAAQGLVGRHSIRRPIQRAQLGKSSASPEPIATTIVMPFVICKEKLYYYQHPRPARSPPGPLLSIQKLPFRRPGREGAGTNSHALCY